MPSLTERQQQLAQQIKTLAEQSGQDPRDVLHEVAGRSVDKAAVARHVCPAAETDWTGTIAQRTAGSDAYAERTLTRMQDRVLANAAALDPADQSLQAQQIRETAASVRDHRAMAARRAEWAAQRTDRHADANEDEA